MSRQGTGARRKSGGRTAPALAPVELVIDELGARGDGIARHMGRKIFIQDALPGERLIARVTGRRGDGLAGEILTMIAPSPDRRVPPCPHFGVCGGCAVQHVNDETYDCWKSGQLTDALSREGIVARETAPLVRTAPGGRRRASLAFKIRNGRAILGFNARSSHDIADLSSCLLLAPELEGILPHIREVLPGVVAEGDEGDAVLTLTDTGLDVLIAAEGRLDLFGREHLAAFAAERDLARLSWKLPRQELPEPIAQRRAPVVSPGNVPVVLPAGAFLQPSLEGERALVRLVLEGVGEAQRVADLFAGIGSFTFPLARTALVHAVEGDRPAITALKSAVDASAGRLRVTAEMRDLARRPVSAEELGRFDAVVFDPPRTGAAEQAAQLAASKVPLIVAVSCNPATLARDLSVLVGTGYRVERVTAIDQFPWTAHLEAVAVLRR